MKEEFKAFVKNKPELIDYVNDGSTTWQKLYEQWYLYGDDDAIWNKYKNVTKEETFSFSKVLDSLKNIKQEDVKKGVNNIQKVVELLQGLLIKDTPKTDVYEPRQLFKKFED